MDVGGAQLVADPPTLSALSANPLFEKAFAMAECQIDPDQYAAGLDRVRAASTNKEKGDSLEWLADFMLRAVPLFDVQGPQEGIGYQLDNTIFVRNIQGSLTQNWGDWVYVECRRKDEAVEAKEMRDFLGKFYERCQVGILFTWSGVTEGATEEIRGASRFKKQYVLVITGSDLQDVLDGRNFGQVLFEKYRETSGL